MQGMARQLGNERMAVRLHRATGHRDDMLAFIGGRLASMRGLQVQEQQAVGQRAEWKHEVAKGESGFWLPDPTRWREAAEMYRTAAAAICGGNLSRGADLLRKAMEAERSARDSFPDFLDEGDEESEALVEGPAAFDDIDPGEGCPVIPLPEEIDLAEQIMRVTEQADPVPARHLYLPHVGWWDEEEEDEEGRDGKGKPKDSEKAT
jgi:hypothetical protein